MDWQCRLLSKWQTYALQRNYFLCENLLLKYCYNLYHRPTSCCFLDMRGLRGWAMQVDRTNMIIRIIVVVQHRAVAILQQTSGLLWMKYRSNFSWIDSVVLKCRRLCWSKHCGPISWIGAYIGVSAVMTHIHCILVTCHRLCTQAKSVGSCASLAGWSGTLASPALSLSFVYRLKGKLWSAKCRLWDPDKMPPNKMPQYSLKTDLTVGL